MNRRKFRFGYPETKLECVLCMQQESTGDGSKEVRGSSLMVFGWLAQWDGCRGQIKLTFRAGTHFQRLQWGKDVKHRTQMILAELNNILCSKTLNA